MDLFIVLGIGFLVIAQYLVTRGKSNLVLKALILAIIGNTLLVIYYTHEQLWYSVGLSLIMFCFCAEGIYRWKGKK